MDKDLTLRLTPQMLKALKKLVATGFYSKNESEAAERLLAKSLELASAGNQER